MTKWFVNVKCIWNMILDTLFTPCIQLRCGTSVYFCVGVILLTYVNVKTSGLLLFLFEDMVLHIAPSRCVSNVNKKNLKDRGNFLIKRYFLLRFVEAVSSWGSSPNLTSYIKRISAYKITSTPEIIRES